MNDARTTRAEYDTVVIGAGAAGLAAAARLVASGRSALILEARDRIGGRIWTVREPGQGVPIELGAEFVHGAASPTRAWLARAGASVLEVPNARFRLHDGAIAPDAGSVDDIRRAFSRHRRAASYEVSLARFVDRIPLAELSPGARNEVRRLAEGFDAADPAHAAAAPIVEEWTGGLLAGASQGRIDGGYDVLVRAMAATLPADRCEIRMQAVVARLAWRRGSVLVEGTRLAEAFQVAARRAIITVPLGVLQARPGDAGHVAFAPALSSKARALATLGSGAVLKLVMRFRSAFWEHAGDGRLREASFVHGEGRPFQVFWTALPCRAPVLVAWLGGPCVAQVDPNGDPARLTRLALQDLESLFGKNIDLADQLEAVRFHDWQRDPFARGAYSYVIVGGGSARAELAETIDDTLYFAGEAADSSGDATTVAGALASGERAAREIIAAS